MLEFVGFQTMGILVLYGITFDAVGVFGLAFQLLFKYDSSYCAEKSFDIQAEFKNAISIWIFLCKRIKRQIFEKRRH